MERKISRFFVSLLFSTFIFIYSASGQYKGSAGFNQCDFTFAVLKYNGGGDWYNGMSGVRNFLKTLSERIEIKINSQEKVVSLLDDDLFLYPFIFINGHGNIYFTPEEAKILKKYLENGGFLFCNDDYGLDKYLRREIKKVFPKKDFVEVPFNHNIYHIYYDFNNGMPKIHKHDGGPARGYGIFLNGRLAVFYDYNTDIADGWEEKKVYNNPDEKIEEAMRMGINIVLYALSGE